jgi:hypothetical protein
MGPLDVVQRGLDSSGRPLVLTRQHWQFIDRLNAGPAQGLLTPIQGGFRRGQGADASGDTHDLAITSDLRRWNLSNDQAYDVKMQSRKWGGSMWERTEAQGFDPHFHNALYGDSPGSPGAKQQIHAWVDLARNGLGNNYAQYADDFWRPTQIKPYQYIPEDDMFEDKDRALLQDVHDTLDQFRRGSFKRDTELKKKISQSITSMGRMADSLTLTINKVDDEGIKRELRDTKKKILDELKNLEFVDGPDNPSDDAMNDLHTN